MKTEVKKYKAIGTVRLVREKGTIPQEKITSSTSVLRIAKELFPDTELVEYFYMLSLNRANKVIDSALISQGGMTGTVVDVRLIAKLALETMACSVILLHNHPSDNREPSEADIRLTKKLKDGLALLDIQVLDHVILTPSDKYYSFADEGRM